MSTIYARYWWNQTPFRVEAGQSYRFVAQGSWIDASHECCAIGYNDERLRCWEWLKREPSGKWFSVIGQIDKKRNTQFDIGCLIETNSVYTATATGTLFCFANDAWFMYWNNKGLLDLDMQPVAT
jgi:hypothetical protein